MKWFVFVVVFLLSACQTSVKKDYVLPQLMVTKAEPVQLVHPLPQFAYDEGQAKRYRDEVVLLCEEIGNKLGSVSLQDCLHEKFIHSGYYSVNNRALVYKSFSGPLNQPKILIVGGTHGDEYSAYSIVFKWLKLLQNRTHSFHWRILPALNPDGLLMPKSQRMNARGVDINRNFPTSDWLDNALPYWENHLAKDKRRYPGEAPSSEPETKWLNDMVISWQPDVIVSIHAPYGILDFDAPSHEKHLAPSKLGTLHLNPLGTYPGSLGRYAGEEVGIPVLTIELAHAGIMPSASAQLILWQDLINWIKKNIT